MGFEIIVMPRPWGQSPLQSPQPAPMKFPCVTALCPCVTAFESSRSLKRTVLVLVLVLSAAVLVLVLVLDPAHTTSAFDAATPSIDDRRQVIDRRMIASSSGLVPITRTSTVASRLSTSTTHDRQNGSDPRMTEYQTAHRRRLTLIADQRISMVDHQRSLAVSLVNQTSRSWHKQC